ARKAPVRWGRPAVALGGEYNLMRTANPAEFFDQLLEVRMKRQRLVLDLPLTGFDPANRQHLVQQAGHVANLVLDLLELALLFGFVHAVKVIAQQAGSRQNSCQRGTEFM